MSDIERLDDGSIMVDGVNIKDIDVKEPVVLTGEDIEYVSELDSFDKRLSNCLGCFVVLVFVGIFAFAYGVYYLTHVLN